MKFKDRQEQISLLSVICCISGIIIFILTIGFFGLIVSKHCVFSKEPVPIQSNTPVLDKFHKDVRERK